jgi:hypothetical protein
MNQVFNDYFAAAPSKYIDGWESICVVNESGDCKFYYVVFNPIDEEDYYAYVFEDMHDLINYFADNAKSERYFPPNFCDAFGTEDAYCRWFDNLRYN